MATGGVDGVSRDGAADFLPKRAIGDVDPGVDAFPAQKRKKFSPIVWDREDLVSGKSSSVPCVDVLEGSCGEVKYDEANDSPLLCMNSSLTYQGSSGELEPGQLEEDSQGQDGGGLGLDHLSHTPNILTSRWASDDDDVQDVGRQEGKSSGTPESGGRSSGCRKGYVHVGSSGSGSEVENEAFVEEAVEVNDGMSVGENYDDDDDVLVPGISGEPTGSMFQECRSVFEFEKLGKISEGSYGLVFKARDKKTGDFVALKKLKMGKEEEGFPLNYLREINNMLAFNHPSVLGIKEVVVDDRDHGFGDVYMVMEYVEHDLKALMESRKHRFSQSEVKCLMMQLLEGVEYLHANWVLHRDLKTSNLLFSNQGHLKICDFGMARQYSSPLKPYTSLVVTLWYRAPELLLGAKEYSTAVDMWSVGCIMAELLTGKPLFDGRTEANQLQKIFTKLGTPNEKIWPGYSSLPGAKNNFRHQPYNTLQEMFPRTSFTDSPILSHNGVDLLSKLLTFDPEKRISAEDALDHAWFSEVPLPKSKEFMPTFPARTTK